MPVELSLRPGHGLTRQEAAALRATLKKAFKEGLPTANELLKEALNNSSPAHALFEWDKDKGYRTYLLEKAAKLAKAVQLGPPKKRKRRKPPRSAKKETDRGNIGGPQ